MTHESDTSRDLLTGIAAIAEHLGWPERRVLHQHEKGMIPTFKQGRLVCARRSTLARHFAAQEAAAARSGHSAAGERSSHSAHCEPSGHSTLHDRGGDDE